MGAFSDLRLGWRRSILLAAVLVAATFSAVAGATTTQLMAPTAGTVPNPCIPLEMVAIQGFLHSYTQTQADGTVRMWLNSQNVTGVSLTTGARYVAQSTNHTVIDLVPGFSQETYVRTHLVRQGEDGTLLVDDDFMLRTRITVNSLGMEVVDLTTDPCH